MFGVRRRWTALTAAGAALLYVVNNYQISGLEHLHLQPLGQSVQSDHAQNVNPLQAFADGGLGFDLTQFGIQKSPSLAGSNDLGIDSYATAAAQRSPAWRDVLSMGEKLALWQDKLAPPERSTSGQISAATTFPTSSPIPAPHGLSGFGSGATGLGMSDFASSMSGIRSGAANVEEGIQPGTMTGLAGVPQTNLLATPLTSLPSSSFGTSAAANDLSVRIASFHIPRLGPAMLNDPNVAQLLVSILRQYDVVALQGIRSSRDDVLPMLVDQLNRSGGRYDYLIGPRVGRGTSHQQFAFVFDTAKLETDRFALYSVDDPEDLMNHEPLVAWFRCKGVPQREAFTFSLVNILIDPSFANAERSVLPGLIAAIEQDGRKEDDWIMLGDFAGGHSELSMLDAGAVRFALSDIPTDIAGTRMLDTLIFSARATSEFSGRAGAFDFLRKYNLSIERALEVSEHMPVWAEFSRIEGAEPGRIAPLIQ